MDMSEFRVCLVHVFRKFESLDVVEMEDIRYGIGWEVEWLKRGRDLDVLERERTVTWITSIA